MSDPALIRATGLGVLAGEQWLFRALDLAVGPGECVALTGTNGSGKSTLLGCLYGTRRPTEGTVGVLGAPPDEQDVGFRRRVAVLLDDSDFFAELSVRQHLELLLGSFPGADVGRVDHWLTEAGLAERAEVHAYHLSAGQRRRLLLLAAIARPHEVLLLDEPERTLDAQGRRWLVDILRAERAEGRAIVLATHHPPLLQVANTEIHLG
jgi:ABC-2 type transport system ATP-binding protein